MKPLKNSHFLLVLLLLSCTAPEQQLAEENDQPAQAGNSIPKAEQVVKPSAVNSTPANSGGIDKNYTDDKGLRQGKFDLYEDDKLLGFETYKNDKLNGPFEKYRNASTLVTGTYTDGKLDGYWKLRERNLLRMVVFYSMGEEIWSGFPLTDRNRYKATKGFGICTEDTVMVECPHTNNKLWYSGLFINKKAVGIHKIYYPTGTIQFVCDYTRHNVQSFYENGKLKEEWTDPEL